MAACLSWRHQSKNGECGCVCGGEHWLELNTKSSSDKMMVWGSDYPASALTIVNEAKNKICKVKNGTKCDGLRYPKI